MTEDEWKKHLDEWIAKWQKQNSELVEWQKQALAYPQKFVVGMPGPDGEWTDIGVTDEVQLTKKYPVEADSIKWGDDTTLPQKKFHDYYKQFFSEWTSEPSDIKKYLDSPKTQKELWDEYYSHISAPASGAQLASQIRETMPELSETVECPDGDCQSFDPNTWKVTPLIGSVWEMIQHLNDRHKWTRERIADWLEESGNNPEFPVPEEE